MKKILLLLLMSKFCYSQNNNGIAYFQLGSTSAEIVKKANGEVIKCNSYSAIDRNPDLEPKTHRNQQLDSTGHIFWLETTTDPQPPIYEIDKASDIPTYEKHSTKSLTYIIPLVIIDKIKLRNIELYFFNDSLISFYCTPSEELAEAMTFKFGASKDSLSTKTIACTYKFTGAKFTEKAITQIKKWRSGKFIATQLSEIYFDSECQKKFIHYLEYNNLKAVGKAKKQIVADDLEGKRKALEVEEKKKTLKNF